MDEKDVGKYSYADLMKWPEQPRYELIEGDPVMMSPPKRRHEKVSRKLYFAIGRYLEGKTCEVYDAPFGVRLFAAKQDSAEKIDTLVIPDISVICDREKLDDDGCKGAPDMITEILSPSTSRYDRFIKFDLYARAGVKEYWIVDPEKKTVAVHLLDEGRYGSPIIYTQSAKVKIEVLDDCWIDLGEVFAE